jgi:hypothetical protein
MPFPDEQALVATPGWSGFAEMNQQDRARATLDFVSDLRSDFALRDETYKLIDAVTFLEQKVKIPTNYEDTAISVQTPLPRHIVNQIVAALSLNTPQVNFNPIKFGDEGENEAAYRSKFFESSWLRQQRDKKRRVHRLFMDGVITKGTGWLKTFERKNRAWAKYTPYSKKLLEELDEKVSAGRMDQDSARRLWDAQTEEKKRGLPYPIETTEVPPECVYYQQGEDGFVRIAEVSAVPYFETLLKYKAALNHKGQVIALDDIASLPLPMDQWGQVFAKTSGTGSTMRQYIERVEVWDVERCTIILRGPGDIEGKSRGSGLVVHEWKHSYGNKDLGTLNGPYFQAAGILTSSREPHKSHLSILYAYLHLFPLLNSLLTMQSQAAFSFAYPAYRRTTPPTYNLPDAPFGLAADEIAGNRQKIVPGAIFPHDIAPMDQPHTSVDLDKAITFVKSLIDLALPDTVQGAISGEMAGYTLNQAAHLATLTWGPIVDNVQDCLSDRVGWESRLIEEKIGEPVYVWGNIPQPRKRPGQPLQYKRGWMGIGPKELDGVHNYEVTLKPATINNDELELRIIRQELDMRTMAPEEAIRRRGRNPVEVERSWLLFELKQDPEIRNNMKQRIFAQLNLKEQAAMQALGPEGQPGGAPPAPISGLPPGAQPGISQGLPTTGFVPPAGSVAPAVPPEGGGAPPPMSLPQAPGQAAGAPAGVRGMPEGANPIPGG